MVSVMGTTLRMMGVHSTRCVLVCVLDANKLHIDVGKNAKCLIARF